MFKYYVSFLILNKQGQIIGSWEGDITLNNKIQGLSDLNTIKQHLIDINIRDSSVKVENLLTMFWREID